jgi:hypothetical protein
MQQRIDMASEQGVTRSGESLHGIVWDVMGQDQATLTGREHGISFLTPDEIRRQMPPLAMSLAL